MLNYDVVVAGAGLAGVTSAALLAKRSKKVLLFDPARDVGGLRSVHAREGSVFAPAPFLTYGYEQGGPLAAIAGELGIAQNVSLLSPAYQVLLPDRRITVFAEQGETLEELRREFPRDAAAVQRCFHDLAAISARQAKSGIYRFYISRRSASAYLRPYRFSQALTAYFDVQTRFFFHTPLDATPLTDLLLLIQHPPRYLNQGWHGFVQRLRDSFLQNGGAYRLELPWPELMTRKKTALGFSVAGEQIGAASILLNAAARRRTDTLFFSIEKNVLPVGMAQTVIGLTAYGPLGSFFSLFIPPVSEQVSAPSGRCSLTASFTGGARSRAELVEDVRGVIPFLDDFLLFDDALDGSGRALPQHYQQHFPPETSAPDPSGVLRATQRNFAWIGDSSGTAYPEVGAALKFAARCG